MERIREAGVMRMKPTVASNHTRIVRIEEDLTVLEEKGETMDKQFIDVAASLGFDLGIEGGMI